jgi:hypothetical protein
LSSKIQVQTAPTPWGNWSAPATVYQCPEMGKDKNIFCYAAKAHPEEEAGGAIIISYVANSFDFGQVIADASLYWPRFVRVPDSRTGVPPVRTGADGRDARATVAQHSP